MMLGQASFLVSAFAINFGLARLLGPSDYGTFGLVMSVLIVVELFVITGIPEVIQKYGGETPELMSLLVRKTLPWQLAYSVAVFAVFWFVTPFIVRSFNDLRLTALLRLASVDILFYGLYKFYQGIQNGLHRFERHAVLGITYAVSKVFLILGLALGGYSLTGAIAGNALASVAGLAMALALTRLPRVQGQLERIPYLGFAVPNVLYFVGLYLLFCIDLWFVKSYLRDVDVGHYVSAGALARVPYVLSIALSASLLPSLSRATKIGDERLVKNIIEESLRYLLMFLLLVSVVVISGSSSLVTLLFGRDFEPASSALSILIVGLSLVTLFAILNTILMARNRMTLCFVMMFGLIVVDVIANALLVPRYGLEGAAVATTTSGLVGSLVAGYLVYKETHALLPHLSWLRLSAIGLLVLGISSLLPLVDWLVIVKGGVIAGLYFGLLAVVGELRRTDINRLRAVVLH